jgi:hypothetical protein
MLQCPCSKPEGDVLNSTIQKTDARTRAELPIPSTLLAKVERADKILRSVLEGVGTKFDINILWQFERKRDNDFDVLLGLSTGTGHHIESRLLPKDALDNPETIRRTLAGTLWMLGDILSAELQQELETIGRNLQALATVTEE